MQCQIESYKDYGKLNHGDYSEEAHYKVSVKCQSGRRKFFQFVKCSMGQQLFVLKGKFENSEAPQVEEVKSHDERDPSDG